MKIAIIGYGLQGVSSYKYWREGNSITICDQNEIKDPPKDVELRIGVDHLKNLNDFDLIVRSPVVHPNDIISANGEQIKDKITTNTNEFFRVCPSKNIIGVTGTKGKGTTSTLITKMLEETGRKVHLGGNIGTPPLEMLEAGINKDDWVVLELANFQLIDLKYSPHIAVCLMVVPEHQDWHEDMQEYINAKKQLFVHQTSQDKVIYYSENEISKDIAASGQAKKIPYFKSPGALLSGNIISIEGNEICSVNDIKLIGIHNRENICAAITTLWQIDKNIEAIRNSIKNFEGLPNRLELLRTIDGVNFYNDSFASAPEASAAAINSIDGNKIMIIGGFDRNLNLDNLTKAIMDNQDDIKKIILIGQSANRTAEELQKVGFSNFIINSSKSIDEITNQAKSLTHENDNVVLSPGFPSFDMFKNFEERGNKFRSAVEKL